MRITTKSIMDHYNRGLSNSLKRYADAQNRVLTRRNFNEVSEDPAAAVRAFKLRSQFRKNAGYMEMNEQTLSRVTELESATLQMSDILTKKLNPDALVASNGTNWDQSTRNTYAATMRGMQKSLILAANTQIGGQFLFGGEETHEVPFVLSEDGRTLTYRGIDVNSCDPADIAKLKEYSKETVYVDLGFGLEETTELQADGKTESKPEIVNTSAFNTAYPGINFLGFGQGEDGLSDNIVVLLGQMADELESPDFTVEDYDKMVNKFQSGMKDFIDAQTKLDTDAYFLDTNMKRLETYSDTLNERITSVERVDMEEAISSYIYQQYCYNAALKVGTNIVSQSLLDFMR